MKQNKNERSPRSINQLEKDFEAAAGSFNTFNRGMNERERILFKGWLRKMRETPQKIA
jgi:hypothetical protein